MVAAAVEGMGYLQIFDEFFMPESFALFPSLNVLLPKVEIGEELAGKRTRESRGGDFVVAALVKALSAKSLEFRHLVVFVACHETLIFSFTGVRVRLKF